LYFHSYITLQTPTFAKTEACINTIFRCVELEATMITVGGLLLTLLSNIFLWCCMVDTPYFYSSWRKSVELRGSHGAQCIVWPTEAKQHTGCLVEHEGPCTNHASLTLREESCSRKGVIISPVSVHSISVFNNLRKILLHFSCSLKCIWVSHSLGEL